MIYYNFNNVASVYDQTRSIPKQLVHKFKKDVISFLQNNFKNIPFQVLSLGIGTGRIEAQLSSINLQLYGVDISKSMIQVLRRKSIKHLPFLSLSDVVTLPFRKHFHTSIAIHLIHMIKNLNEFFNEIQRISHSLIFGDAYTAAYDNPLYKFFKQSLEENGWKEKLQGFSCGEFKDFLIKIGYKVKTVELTKSSQISKYEIYKSLKNRYFSGLWDIPNSIYLKSLIDLDKKIKEKSLSIEGYYKTISFLKLNFVKF